MIAGVTVDDEVDLVADLVSPVGEMMAVRFRDVDPVDAGRVLLRLQSWHHHQTPLSYVCDTAGIVTLYDPAEVADEVASEIWR